MPVFDRLVVYQHLSCKDFRIVRVVNLDPIRNTQDVENVSYLEDVEMKSSKDAKSKTKNLLISSEMKKFGLVSFNSKKV